ncbi:ABC transporter permease [Castellaniella sp.]|uniref:ABC transporter permease n=1 Tax=Castellaniella sp. TaxID=1955812 RepID=UPI002AFDF420|nr:ABC transporter permease [Castellaniella sp.]
MQEQHISLYALTSSFIKNKALILAMTKRDISSRYRGSAIGLLWSFFNPLFMLAVYTFVFSVVFRAKWGGTEGSRTEFALMLFSGLIVFNLFAECINRAPSLIVSNVSYVKKVVFPLEIFPWISLGSALFHALISMSVWLAAYLIFFGIPHVTVLLLPIAIIPLLLFTAGASWVLASLGVYLRDISQITSIITTMLMFMSPIFYPITAIPEKIRPIFMLNPLSPVIEQVRDLAYFGRMPNIGLWLVTLLISVLVLWLGFFWFQKTRRGFADVI